MNDDHDIDYWRILDAAAKMASVLAAYKFDAELRSYAIRLLAKDAKYSQHSPVLDAVGKMAVILAVCEFDVGRRWHAIRLLAKWAGLAHDMKETEK